MYKLKKMIITLFALMDLVGSLLVYTSPWVRKESRHNVTHVFDELINSDLFDLVEDFNTVRPGFPNSYGTQWRTIMTFVILSMVFSMVGFVSSLTHDLQTSQALGMWKKVGAGAYWLQFISLVVIVSVYISVTKDLFVDDYQSGSMLIKFQETYAAFIVLCMMIPMAALLSVFSSWSVIQDSK